MPWRWIDNEVHNLATQLVYVWGYNMIVINTLVLLWRVVSKRNTFLTIKGTEPLNIRHYHFQLLVYSMKLTRLIVLFFFVVLCLAAVHILVLSDSRFFLDEYLLMLKMLLLRLLFQRMMIISMTFSMPPSRNLRRLMMTFRMMQMRRNLWLWRLFVCLFTRWLIFLSLLRTLK